MIIAQISDVDLINVSCKFEVIAESRKNTLKISFQTTSKNAGIVSERILV